MTSNLYHWLTSWYRILREEKKVIIIRSALKDVMRIHSLKRNVGTSQCLYFNFLKLLPRHVSLLCVYAGRASNENSFLSSSLKYLDICFKLFVMPN